jgi:predicted MFS family arabinose efflux permease
MAGIASVAGWHIAGFGAAAVGASVLVMLWMRRRLLTYAVGDVVVGSASPAQVPTRARPFAFLSSGAVWLSFAFFLVTTMAFGILQNFAPAILSEVYGVSLILANGGLTAYLLGSGAGMIVGGFLAERGDRIVATALGFAALMSAVLASGSMPRLALWPLMAAMGFGVGTAGPGRDLLVRRAATSVRPKLVRPHLRVRLFGIGFRSGVVAGDLRTAARRRALSPRARRHRRAAGDGTVLRAARRQPRARGRAGRRRERVRSNHPDA